MFKFFKKKQKNKITVEEISYNGKYKGMNVLDILANEKANLKLVLRKEKFSFEEAKTRFPFLPNDFLEYANQYKWIELGAGILGSYSHQPSNLSGNEHMQEYLDGYGKGYKVEDWYFIANDGMGGEYAFSTKGNDERVYYFDHEYPETLKAYKNFTEFVASQI